MQDGRTRFATPARLAASAPRPPAPVAHSPHVSPALLVSRLPRPRFVERAGHNTMEDRAAVHENPMFSLRARAALGASLAAAASGALAPSHTVHLGAPLPPPPAPPGSAPSRTPGSRESVAATASSESLPKPALRRTASGVESVEMDAFAQEVRRHLSPAVPPTTFTAALSEKEMRALATYALVLPWKDAATRASSLRILEHVHEAGLRFSSYKSCAGDRLFVEIFADTRRLLLEADHRDILLPLDPFYLRLLDLRTNVLATMSMHGDVDSNEELRVRKSQVMQAVRHILPEVRARFPDVRASAGARAEDERRFQSALTDPRLKQLGMMIPDLPGSRFSPAWDSYQYIYSNLKEVPDGASDEDAALIASLFAVHPRTHTCLSPADCIKLLRMILEAPRRDTPPGAGLDVETLIHQGTIIACFPLHSTTERRELAEAWGLAYDEIPDEQLGCRRCCRCCACCRFRRVPSRACVPPWTTPVDEIRSYFGEKVAFYFSFLSFFTAFLVLPAVFGLLTFAFQTSERNNDTIDATSAFAMFMAVWSAVFIEFWKRRESTDACKWGVSNFSAQEVHRPAFMVSAEVTQQPSPVTGKITFHRSAATAVGKQSLSATIIGVTLAGLIAGIISLFSLRVIIETAWPSYGGYAFGVVNTLQIQIMSQIYPRFARILTSYENQPTQTAFETSLIFKTVVFQVINSYFALFYIAFLKYNADPTGPRDPTWKAEGTIDQCVLALDGVPDPNGYPDCMYELQLQLAALLVSRLVLQNIAEAEGFLNLKRIVTGPIGACVRACRKEPEVDTSHASAAEQELEEEEYDTYDDYLEQIILFGYATLFVAAFPLAPVLVFVNNIFEVLLDSWKVLHETQRPNPHGAQNIGPWNFFLQAMSTAGTLTNLALVIFTARTEFFGVRDFREKVTVFIVVEHVLLFGRWVVDLFIPDVPEFVEIQLQRQEYLVHKLVDGVPDEYEIRNPQPAPEERWYHFLFPCCFLRQRRRAPNPDHDAAQRKCRCACGGGADEDADDPVDARGGLRRTESSMRFLQTLSEKQRKICERVGATAEAATVVEPFELDPTIASRTDLAPASSLLGRSSEFRVA